MTEIPVLSNEQIEAFVRDGFVRIDQAFSTETASACRAILWNQLEEKEDDPSTWTRPVVRLNDRFEEPFREAVTSPKLLSAFDALVGANRWMPRISIGTFPIRFPSSLDPGDCGWHVDVSFGWENQPDFMEWRVNLASKGRALLMLFLLSDVVGEEDAPTRIRVGSHLEIAKRLAKQGEEGMSLRQLVSTQFAESDHLPQALATGTAGTVYLCHPFVVHSAQPMLINNEQKKKPRFLAQPPLLSRGEMNPLASLEALSPVERAIRLALDSTS